MYANAPINDRSRSLRISPGRRGGQLQKILENLAMLQPAFGDTIQAMIGQELSRLPWGATVVVITSHVSADFQRSLLRLARSGGASRFVLIAIGERPVLFPDVQKRFQVYHLAREEAWDVIESIQFDRL